LTSNFSTWNLAARYLDVKRLLFKTSAVSTARVEATDHVDRWLEEIRTELPADLDLTVEGIVDRIQGINRRLQRVVEETLSAYGLSQGEWKVLSSLRWAGAPYRRSAGDLARIAELSSGAMTNRLDQLEQSGLVRRLRDPDDRRGVLVELTAEGRKVWEEALGVQAAKEALFASALTKAEREQLNALLRRLMLEFEERGVEK
jgi:DNA-binding MarR family transcriptional regulator